MASENGRSRVNEFASGIPVDWSPLPDAKHTPQYDHDGPIYDLEHDTLGISEDTQAIAALV